MAVVRLAWAVRMLEVHMALHMVRYKMVVEDMNIANILVVLAEAALAEALLAVAECMDIDTNMVVLVQNMDKTC